MGNKLSKPTPEIWNLQNGVGDYYVAADGAVRTDDDHQQTEANSYTSVRVMTTKQVNVKLADSQKGVASAAAVAKQNAADIAAEKKAADIAAEKTAADIAAEKKAAELASAAAQKAADAAAASILRITFINRLTDNVMRGIEATVPKFTREQHKCYSREVVFAYIASVHC